MAHKQTHAAWQRLMAELSSPRFLSALESLIRDAATADSLRLVHAAYCLLEDLYISIPWPSPELSVLSLVISIHKRLLLQQHRPPQQMQQQFVVYLTQIARNMQAIVGVFDVWKPHVADRHRVWKVVSASLPVVTALLAGDQSTIQREEWREVVETHIRLFPQSPQLLLKCCNIDCTNLAGFGEGDLLVEKQCCRSAQYCSVTCQGADWLHGGHQSVCTAAADSRASLSDAR